MRVAFSCLDELQTLPWEVVRDRLATDLGRLQSAINTTWDVAHNVDGTQKSSFASLTGIVWGTLAQQPTGLSIVNDKLLYFVTDYGHLVYWDGTASAWKFAPGDVGNGFIRDCVTAPQEAGWQLCDGTATSYLTVGATLASVSFTTPNLTSSPAYRKTAAAYSGTINAAGATGGTAPGTDSQGSHNHGGAAGSHSHGVGSLATSGPDAFTAAIIATTGSGVTLPSNAHTHNPITGSTDAQSPSISADGSHSHTVNSHTHTTGDPANISVLPYFRR